MYFCTYVIIYLFIFISTYVGLRMSTSTTFAVIFMNHTVYNAVVVQSACPNDV
jgi:hypothetical protein